jgi:hypothetical protein
MSKMISWKRRMGGNVGEVRNAHKTIFGTVSKEENIVEIPTEKL